MDKRNTVRLIIWGLLFLVILGCGIIGLSLSKAKQRANPYETNYNDDYTYEETNEYNYVE